MCHKIGLSPSLNEQVTGVMLMAILCVCYLFAVPAIRKSWLVAKMRAAKVLNNFEAFYVTHIFMAVSVLVLLIIHPWPGPALHNRPHRSTTWAYLAGGSCVYILERIARVLRSCPLRHANSVNPDFLSEEVPHGCRLQGCAFPFMTCVSLDAYQN